MSVYKDQISNQLQNRGQFSQIPNEIWKVEDLSTSARTVWMYLASEGPGWKSSYSNIGRNIEMALNTVRKAVKELQDKNMLVATPHDEGCDFNLLSSDQWAVTFKGTPSKKSICKNSTGAYAEIEQAPMQNLQGIQYDLKLTNTTERERSGSVESNSSFKDKESTPEYSSLLSSIEVTSPWYQRLVAANSIVATHFETLTTQQKLFWVEHFDLNSDQNEFIEEYLQLLQLGPYSKKCVATVSAYA